MAKEDFMKTNGKFEAKPEYRVVDLETASGEKIDDVLERDVDFYIDMIENGEEDFIILNSQEGFLQFYGVDNRFVAEMHIKCANDDFRTFSFINKEKENALERGVLETPYGNFTPLERDVVSYEQIKKLVRNYYKYPVCEEFLESVDYVETTEETKKYMGL